MYVVLDVDWESLCSFVVFVEVGSFFGVVCVLGVMYVIIGCCL